jgi:hypothetical protein
LPLPSEEKTFDYRKLTYKLKEKGNQDNSKLIKCG